MYETEKHSHNSYDCEDCLNLELRIKAQIKDSLRRAAKQLQEDGCGNADKLIDDTATKSLIQGLELALKLVDLY